MPEAFAKFRVGTPGAGAAHASYITRASALEPKSWSVSRGQLELDRDQVSVAAALEEDLHAGGIGETDQAHQVDPVWTWNAPSYLTGDHYGTQEGESARVLDQVAQRNSVLHGKITEGINSPNRRKRLEEKTTKLRAHFGSKEQFERAKGGRTHYRVILSFDVPASNEQIQDLTNQFLRDTFPKAIGFAAIHRDTDHPHVHVYLHARQIDGRKIYLSRDAYRTIDENWARIYSKIAGDQSVFVQHLRKKEETRQWKLAAAEAYKKGEPIPPKPERDNDRRERLAEQRLSAQRSDARDRGNQLKPRPEAQPVMRPGSEKETSRLLAKEEVAREELAHLIRTEAPANQIKWAARTAHEFSVALQKTLATREKMGKERPPQVVYTTEEWKQIKEYSRTHDLAVKDDRAAARLQSTRILAGAEVKDAQARVDAFETSRHFWKFHVEGLGKLSLREVEQRIKTHTEEKFRMYNFLRPTKREEIQLKIEFLQETKKDIQKQIAAAEQPARTNLGAARLNYETASKLVEYTEEARAQQGKGMPPPAFKKAELARMLQIANRNKDAKLLAFVYDEAKDGLLANPTPAALSAVKGKAVMARMEMLKAADRLKAAIEYGDFRQLPITDARGLTYTKSVSEAEPKSALETLIRHFTDSPEKKEERQALADAKARQLVMAEGKSRDARDYSLIRDRIAQHFYLAAGVREKDVAPNLTREQITELNKYADTVTFFSRDRAEFHRAARMAEERLERRDAAEVGKAKPDELSLHARSRGLREESCPEIAAVTPQRSEPTDFSRGR
jgi:MobA/VirD2-like, nuclease domain